MVLKINQPAQRHVRERLHARLRYRNKFSGILDICMRLDLVDENMGSKSRSLLLRIVSMLTKMARPSSVTQAGMQTFTEMALRELFEFLKPKC